MRNDYLKGLDFSHKINGVKRTLRESGYVSDDFEKRRRRFKLIFKLTFAFIALAFALTVAFYVFVGTKVVSEVQANDGNIGITIGKFLKDIKTGMEE